MSTAPIVDLRTLPLLTQINEYDFRRERGDSIGLINGAVLVRFKLTDEAREIIDNRSNWHLAS